MRTRLIRCVWLLTGAARLFAAPQPSAAPLHVPHSGPTLKSFALLPGALKLHFDHVDGGLVVKGEKPAEFAIAGDDRKWYWANARIEGDTVVVSSPSVPDPKAVRYAWQANPAATLLNGAGLPAVPFRTDHWPGITAGRTAGALLSQRGPTPFYEDWEKADTAMLNQKLKVLWIGCGTEDPGYNGVKGMTNC